MAVLAAALVALPARAALFDDEEARRRIEQTNLRLAQVQKQIEDRLGAIEQQLKNQGLVELFTQVEQLKSEVAQVARADRSPESRIGANAEAPARSLHRSRLAAAQA